MDMNNGSNVQRAREKEKERGEKKGERRREKGVINRA
jgi:hypothetical protein